MMDRPVEQSPQRYARIGGALYLYIIIAAGFAEGFVRSRLIVSGNAAATANNVLAFQSLWRAAFVGELTVYVCAISLVLTLYVLLRPVNGNIALLAAFFNLVSISVEAINSLAHLAPLIILGNADYLKVFDTNQRQALASLSLELHQYGFGLSLLLFSFVLVLNGYLIFKSEYFPWTLGILVIIAGLCYLTNSYALFLAPALAAKLLPGILVPSFVGELSLCLWLMVMGVNVPEWKEKANRLAIS